MKKYKETKKKIFRYKKFLYPKSNYDHDFIAASVNLTEGEIHKHVTAGLYLHMCDKTIDHEWGVEVLDLEKNNYYKKEDFKEKIKILEGYLDMINSRKIKIDRIHDPVLLLKEKIEKTSEVFIDIYDNHRVKTKDGADYLFKIPKRISDKNKDYVIKNFLNESPDSGSSMSNVSLYINMSKHSLSMEPDVNFSDCNGKTGPYFGDIYIGASKISNDRKKKFIKDKEELIKNIDNFLKPIFLFRESYFEALGELEDFAKKQIVKYSNEKNKKKK